MQAHPHVRHTYVWTGKVPRPWLSTPEVILRQLARHHVLLGEEEPLSDVKQLADRIVRASGVVYNASQRRVISMCVNYASEVLRAASELVLNNSAARYGHENPVPHDRIWRFSMEQLGVWNRRRGLPWNLPMWTMMMFLNIRSIFF